MKRWGTSISPIVIKTDAEPENLHDPYEDPDEPARAMPKFLDPVDGDTNQLLDQRSSPEGPERVQLSPSILVLLLQTTRSNQQPHRQELSDAT